MIGRNRRDSYFVIPHPAPGKTTKNQRGWGEGTLRNTTGEGTELLLARKPRVLMRGQRGMKVRNMAQINFVP